MAAPITEAEQSVLDLIGVEEIVSVAQALIAAPGENPPGGEQATAAALIRASEKRGLDHHTTEVEPGRPNVSVTLLGGSGPGLLLLGHTDVVPIGDGWSVSPTGGDVIDGRLYGRGSTDMKGGLAACLVAMSALRRARASLRGPVELAAVMDEEDSGLGIRHYLRERARSGGAAGFRGCIVAEPTDLQTIIAARGASYVNIEVTGQAAHAGNPDDGVNAIYGAAAIVREVEAWHLELKSRAHPLVGPPTWNVGVVRGGTGGSIVPAVCSITADRRLLPDESPSQVLADIRQRLAALNLENAGMTVHASMPMDMPGFETPPEHSLVTTVDGALTAAGGPGLPLGGWTAACDGGYVRRDEGVPVVVLGPGSVQTQAHRADESVGIDELLTAARTYALTAMRLLGR